MHSLASSSIHCAASKCFCASDVVRTVAKRRFTFCWSYPKSCNNLHVMYMPALFVSTFGALCSIACSNNPPCNKRFTTSEGSVSVSCPFVYKRKLCIIMEQIPNTLSFVTTATFFHAMIPRQNKRH